MRLYSRLGPALVLVALSLTISQPAAEAHERRTVAGDLTFVVGWANEPALEGNTNGIDLRVLRADNNEPVEGAQQTLKAEVVVGNNALPVQLQPRFRQPGAYNAPFVPTR